MAEINNLKVKAGEENIIKAAKVECFSIFEEYQPIDKINKEKMLLIEAVNGRWTFNLNDITYFEFDIVTQKRFIHVTSRAEVKDAEIQ